MVVNVNALRSALISFRTYNLSFPFFCTLKLIFDLCVSKCKMPHPWEDGRLHARKGPFLPFIAILPLYIEHSSPMNIHHSSI